MKLDLLPESAQPSANLMFMHTPKWTLTVSPVKTKRGGSPGHTHTSSKRSPSHSPPRTGSSHHQQTLSLLEEIDVEGEKYLRAGIKKR
ncbi:hypothetical protein EON65_43650 [archaeon]|nr:MAG: hypothetical protein EON65_43650 [archaeon]